MFGSRELFLFLNWQTLTGYCWDFLIQKHKMASFLYRPNNREQQLIEVLYINTGHSHGEKQGLKSRNTSHAYEIFIMSYYSCDTLLFTNVWKEVCNCCHSILSTFSQTQQHQITGSSSNQCNIVKTDYASFFCYYSISIVSTSGLVTDKHSYVSQRHLPCLRNANQTYSALQCNTNHASIKVN